MPIRHDLLASHVSFLHYLLMYIYFRRIGTPIFSSASYLGTYVNITSHDQSRLYLSLRSNVFAVMNFIFSGFKST